MYEAMRMGITTTHYLILFQMNRLIVVHLEKHLSGRSFLVKFPKKILLLQILQQHCSHYKIHNPNVRLGPLF
jgi:hypothetical protein